MNGCCCVEASTLVLMADGSQRPIRDLRIGDLVRTETGTAHIRDIIKGREPELVRIGLAQGGNLVATGNHPLFTDKGVKRCSEVVVDDRLRTEGGCVAIESIELAPHEPATSNLTLGKPSGAFRTISRYTTWFWMDRAYSSRTGCLWATTTSKGALCAHLTRFAAQPAFLPSCSPKRSACAAIRCSPRRLPPQRLIFARKTRSNV